MPMLSYVLWVEGSATELFLTLVIGSNRTADNRLGNCVMKGLRDDPIRVSQ